jgi:ligand-binding sensor domain-containing protein/signal transduction histidine kinase
VIKLNKKILFFPVCLLLIKFTLSQTLPLKQYSIDEGLASSTVNCIFQDSRGYLWFGTQNGISRFDGLEFKNWYIQKGLSSDYIMDIYEDPTGKIWFATSIGGIASFTSGEFKNYTVAEGLASNRTYSMTRDQQGYLWIGTAKGISRFDGESFYTYTEKDGLIDNMVLDILIDKGGDLWFATGGGISVYSSGHFVNYKKSDGLAHPIVLSLLEDKKGKIWIGTWGGLNLYDDGEFYSYGTKDGLAHPIVKSIIEDSSGNIWIGTEGGLGRFSHGIFTNYDARNGLRSNKILCLFEDREKNIWIGTNLGVNRLNSLDIATFSTTNGLSNDQVWAIIQDREGKYWFGTDNGLSVYANGTFKNYTVKDNLVNNSIFSLLEDRLGNVWIGTGGGISVYSAGKFKNYTTADGLKGSLVLSLLEDHQGTIWIGTTAGLCCFRQKKFHPPPFKYEPAPIQVILEDRNRDLWFSNSRCLNRVSQNQLRSFTTRDGLPHNFVVSLYEDIQGRLWIGTKHGLSCYRDGIFTNYSTRHGLFHHVCVSILEDDKGNLWIGTLKGINRFDGESFKVYTSRDGFSSNEMSQKACLKDNQGYLWFGTVKGVTKFNPNLDRFNWVPPPVYITNFRVFSQDLPLSAAYELKFNQNYLGFDFVGLCFTSPEDVVYQYRLEGIDRDWQQTSNRRVSYPFLPPGDYIFSVTAKNNDGIKSLNPAEIRFNILPPFWQTWWFRVMLGLTLLSVMILIILFRVKRVREKVANEERNKQLVMAQKMELLGILAGGALHDLKNLLAVIITYSSIGGQIVEDVVEEDQPMKKIKSAATKAVQLVKQILSFTREKQKEKTAVNLTSLLEDILDILKITTPREIEIVWEPPDEGIWLRIDPTRFQQMVMNLCLNAVKAMPEGGELKILLFGDQRGQIILQVSDTGVGIDEENLEKIFDPLYTTEESGKGTGLGLFVVKQAVDEYKGEIEVHSQPGKGTTFNISFPAIKTRVPG